MEDKLARQVAALDVDARIDAVFAHIEQLVSPDVGLTSAQTIRRGLETAPSPEPALLGRLPKHWLRYRPLRRERSAGGGGFSRYLEVVLGCDGLWDFLSKGRSQSRSA